MSHGNELLMPPSLQDMLTANGSAAAGVMGMVMCTAALAWTCGKSSSSVPRSWCAPCSWRHRGEVHLVQ